MRKSLPLLGCVLLSALLPACTRRAAQIPGPPPLAPGAVDLSQALPGQALPGSQVIPDSGFLDLRPGWRLRVVTPLLKSGGFALRTFSPEASGNTVTLSTGGELEGYETAFYAVAPHPQGGVRISFDSAEVTKQGVSAPQPRPTLPLFNLPSSARFVRLVFLTRVSQADHDMAVLAAGDIAALDRLAAEFQSNPRACAAAGRNYCAWIPLGIAVRPEAPGAGPWDPVR
jgi:hypothetical protein